MAFTTKPTILFVHGAWHEPAHWKPLMNILEAAGYPTACPLQPSYGADPPTTNLYDDAAVIHSAARSLVNEGKYVVVAMHSYGGCVGTQAITKDLATKQRAEKGLPGGVVRLFYICAFLLPMGDSLGSAFGGNLPPFIKTEPDGSCNMINPEHMFYNDMPLAEQKHWMSLVKPHCAIAQLTPLTCTAYKYIPTSYLFTENDQPLPVQYQHGMVQGAGVEIQINSCTGGHSPYLSMPHTVAMAIRSSVGDTMAE